MALPSHKDILASMKGVTPGNKKAVIKLVTAFFEDFYASFDENFRGPVGPKWSKEEVSALILSLVPSLKGEDGKTPTNKELLALIKPLIPKKADDGKTPTKKELTDLIKALLPSDQYKELTKQIKDMRDGLEKDQEKKKKTVSGGGKAGGMGDPQHETFAITTATVSISAAFPIAARGNAILKCAYQGQILHKDTHFTVGTDNQTITFVSAVRAQFENNTVVELTYIR